jgi:hypothetical protein
MRRGHPSRRFWLLIAALFVAAALTPATAIADPAPRTTMSISGQAELISLNHVNVYITVQGSGGFGGVDVGLTQATFFGPATGNGFTEVFCDGQRRTYQVTVFGGNFTLGEAVASATGGCPSGTLAASNTIMLKKP